MSLDRWRRCRFVVPVIALLGSATSAVAQQWADLSPLGPLPAPRGSHGTTAVLDAATDRMIVFAGRTSAASNSDDVWVLAEASGTGNTPSWSRLVPETPFGSPAARDGHSAVYDAANNRMIVFGGCHGGCLPALNDVWVLSHANGLGGTPAWTRLLPQGESPAPRVRPTAVYDPAGNRMIVFGGQDGGGFSGSTFAEVWVLSHANGLGGTPAWTRLSPTGELPPGQFAATGIYDPGTNRMTVFGGMARGTGAPTNAAWVLKHANGAGGIPHWTRLAAAAPVGAPGVRGWHSGVYSAARNTMIVFGGANGVTNLSDAWTLSYANGLGGTPQWTRVIVPAAPTARASHGAVLHEALDRMVIFGGVADSGFLNDAWVLANASGLDTTPPRLALPSDLLVEAADAHGAVVTYEVSAVDDQDARPVVECAPTSGSVFAPGRTTVVCRAHDASGNQAEGSFVVQVAYGFAGFEAPIRSDGTSVFRQGRTIPTKFTLYAGGGTIISTASAVLQVWKLTDAVLGTIEEVTPEASGGSNADATFRFDPASGQYVYNLSIAGYSQGTYILRARVSDAAAHDVQVSIR